MTFPIFYDIRTELVKMERNRIYRIEIKNFTCTVSLWI